MWKIQALPSLMGKRHKQQWRLWVQWVQPWAGGCSAMLPSVPSRHRLLPLIGRTFFLEPMVLQEPVLLEAQ